MGPRVIARYPRAGSWLTLILLLVALYVCLDLRLLHRLPALPNPELDGLCFSLFCLLVTAVTGVVAKEVISPANIFTADSQGVVLNYCFYRRKIKIPWRHVLLIRTGRHAFTFPHDLNGGSRSSSTQIRAAVEIFFDSSVDLGLLGEVLAHPDGRHAILLGDYLFIHGFDKSVSDLRALHPSVFPAHGSALAGNGIL